LVIGRPERVAEVVERSRNTQLGLFSFDALARFSFDERW
jgi:hypothetical protein